MVQTPLSKIYFPENLDVQQRAFVYTAVRQYTLAYENTKLICVLLSSVIERIAPEYY